MKPYVGDSLKSRKRAQHDIHHRTQDGGLHNRQATAKAERHAARRAGKIYALVTAWYAAQAQDDEPELAAEAAKWAKSQLNSMGIEPAQLYTAQKCIEAAAKLHAPDSNPLPPGD